jgi:hypothetical protein
MGSVESSPNRPPRRNNYCDFSSNPLVGFVMQRVRSGLATVFSARRSSLIQLSSYAAHHQGEQPWPVEP